MNKNDAEQQSIHTKLGVCRISHWRMQDATELKQESSIPWFAAVVASLSIGTAGSSMTELVAVVAHAQEFASVVRSSIISSVRSSTGRTETLRWTLRSLVASAIAVAATS